MKKEKERRGEAEKGIQVHIHTYMGYSHVSPVFVYPFITQHAQKIKQSALKFVVHTEIISSHHLELS